MVPNSNNSADEPKPLAYTAGDVIAGKYELDEVLGEGGMGAVFRARNTTIDMPVAIKLIRADLNRELFSGRLLQEARAAAKLAHPAIVRVFDVGQTALGDPFIVMELLSGETLATIIERESRLSSVRAVQLLLPIADALSAAHAKGFVHRDVKPDNVFVVVSEGQLQPKLVDFGIVKLAQRDKNSKLTQVGTVLGSPDYMSPEQARGLENIDPRSDVWSFSVLLYEAISGQTPFSSSNYNALLRMIVEDEAPTLRSLRAADAQLSAIVAQGMSKDPAQRFQSMNRLGRALAEWLISQGAAEDVCGVSLEAKWLSRSTDPQARAARISRLGPSDAWPEAPSGVRAIRNGEAGNAPTMVASDAGTPTSVAPFTRTVAPGGRRLYLGLAGGAVALTIPLSLWSWSSGGETPKANAPSAGVGAVRASAEPKAPPKPAPELLAPAPIPVEALPTAPLEAPQPPTRAKAASQSKPRPAQPETPKTAPATPAKPAGPASDLLSPY